MYFFVDFFFLCKINLLLKKRLGQCESYDFGLELETVLAKAIAEVSTKLTPQIIPGDRNEVYHMEWDNLNVLTTTIHGSNVVNSIGGIMIQGIKPAADVEDMIPKRCLPLYKRNNTRSLKLEESHNLSPACTSTRDGTKPIPSTRSIGYRVNFKVSVSPKNPIPIPSTFRYYFDTFSILCKYRYFNIKLQ